MNVTVEHVAGPRGGVPGQRVLITLTPPAPWPLTCPLPFGAALRWMGVRYVICGVEADLGGLDATEADYRLIYRAVVDNGGSADIGFGPQG